MGSQEENGRVWKDVSRMYRNGFIRLVSRQRPGVMGVLERFFCCFGRSSFSEGDVGFAIYFGDIQRMYLRYLHTKLIDLTVKIQLDYPLSSGREGSLSGADELGPLLRRYGKRATFLSSRFSRILLQISPCQELAWKY